MATISFDPRLNQQVGKNNHGVVLEEIEGLIRVYKDGNVERPPIIPNVSCTSALGVGVTAKDVVIDSFTNLWARIYVPSNCPERVPVLIYFHGGGFCVGSAAWSCYHDFIANLAIKASCVILSINYRLSPENRLPTAYEDGTTAIVWLKQQALNGSLEHKWWLSRCNFSSLLLAGDSAGANIAYHVTTRLGTNGTFEPSNTNPLRLKGTILVQPFFGGEARTRSEKNLKQPPNSALTLPASDTYWHLSLPIGANRDHPWCNPLVNGTSKLRGLVLPSAMLICISEMDILKDRNLGFSNALASAGKRVEIVMHKGVGHAFHILHNSPNSQARTQELVSHLKSFINKYQ